MESIRYYPEIKRYVESRVGNPEDVEDLTQQVFFKYYEIKSRGKLIQNSNAYLTRIAQIEVTEFYRKKNKQPQIVQLHPKFTDKISDKKQAISSKTKEITEELKEIISNLPPKAKEAVELILCSNLSYEEAAQKANCSVKVFCERFYKGLKNIIKIYNS